MTSLQVVREGLKRLNTHEPQFPADSYFIKHKQEVLARYLSDTQLIDQLEGKATPRTQQRLQLFDLKSAATTRKPTETTPLSTHK